METKLILDVITAIAAFVAASAAVAAAIIARAGLNTWKDQLHGSKNHEIAWKYLKATLKLRDAINEVVRSPMIWAAEFASAAEEFYGKENVESARRRNSKADSIAVYAIRWRQLDKAREELRDASLDAEIWWGHETKELDKPLQNSISTLFFNLENFLNPDREISYDRNIIYYNPSNDNEYDKNLKEALLKIENVMRPHIKNSEEASQA